MRAIWSQSARPKLSRIQPTTETANGIVNRKSTTVRLARRLTFSDAFTILLAPVLATAAVADMSWKETKRKAWDEKIAQMQKEVEQIHQREIQAWESLQLRSARAGAIHQRRSYSTAALAVATNTEDSQFEDVSWKENVDGFQHEQGDSTRIWQEREGMDIKVDDKDLQNIRRFERLIAVKLALKVILWMQVGNSPRFDHLSPSPIMHDNVVPKNSDLVIDKLKSIQQGIDAVPHIPHHVYASKARLTQSPKSQAFNQELYQLAENLRANRITLPRMLEEFAVKVLKSKESPTARTYAQILNALCVTKQESLIYHVLAALGDSKLPLEDYIVKQVLFAYGQNMDIRRLDDFLKELPQQDGQFNTFNKWEHRTIQRIQLPVPASLNPSLLQVLIHLALKCDQLPRAQAWASVVMKSKRSYANKWKSKINEDFLRYCTSKLDWARGRNYLNSLVRASPFIAAGGMHRLQQSILLMLDFCVACDQRETYSTILTTSVRSGIPCPEIDITKSQSYSTRETSIIQEWKKLESSTWKEPHQQTDIQKAIAFQQTIEQSMASYSSFRKCRPNKAVSENWIPNPNEQKRELAILRDAHQHLQKQYADLQNVHNRLLEATQHKKADRPEDFKDMSIQMKTTHLPQETSPNHDSKVRLEYSFEPVQRKSQKRLIRYRFLPEADTLT